MNALVPIVLLAVGLALIVKGGDWFVASAVRTARWLRMPRVVIGSTLVSLATSLPELTVSIISGAEGESGLAVGNAVGSCICNIGLILGVTSLMKGIDVDVRALAVPFGAMVIFGFLRLFMTLDLRLSRAQGWVLVVLGASYYVWDFISSYRTRAPEEKREAGRLVEAVAEAPQWIETRGGTAFQFVGAALVVVVGSRLLVTGAVDLARLAGIPPIFIGLSIVAVGTSIPEFVTALTSSRKNVSDLSLGNVLGANIANLSFIVGAAATLTDVRMTRLTQLFNIPAMLLVMAALLVFCWRYRRLDRTAGTVLLMLYVLYLASLGIVMVMVEIGRG